MASTTVTPETAADPAFVASAINALASAVSNIQASGSGATYRLKPAKPPHFRGNYGRDATTPRDWLFTVDQYFLACNVDRDRDKLAFVATLLQDNANTWWRSQFALQPDGSYISAIGTWSDFKAALIRQFEPINRKLSAREELARLKQVRSVQAYTSRFRALCLEIDDLSDAEKRYRYLEGLKDRVRLEVLQRQCNTFDEMCTVAVHWDSLDFHVRGPRQSSSSYYPRPAAASHSGPTPMDLGAMQEHSDSPIEPESGELLTMRYKPLTPADRERLRKAGACFYCKEPGHIAPNCPKKRKMGNRRAQ